MDLWLCQNRTKGTFKSFAMAPSGFSCVIFRSLLDHIRSLFGFISLGRGKLHRVSAFVLVCVTEAKQVRDPQRQEDQGAHNPRPRDNDDHRQELDADLVAAINQPVAAHSVIWVTKEAESEHAPKTACSVHGTASTTSSILKYFKSMETIW